MTTESKALAQKPAVEAKNGLLTFNSLESLHRMAQYLVASKMLPKQYQTPEIAAIGIQFAIQLGFRDNWLLALRQIAVINGNPAMFGDLPLAKVRESGLLEEFDEFLFDKDGKRLSLENGNISSDWIGACCRYKRKGFPTAESVFTVEDAKRAGVWGKNVWLPYPKRMIQMRVRSGALKDGFADILGGMSIGEYDQNTVIEKGADCEVGLTGTAKLAAFAANPIPIQEEPQLEVTDVEYSEAPEPPAEGSFAAFNEPTTVKGK